MTDLTNCKELDEQKTPVVSDLEDAPEIQSEVRVSECCLLRLVSLEYVPFCICN